MVNGLNWDDELPLELRRNWERWFQELVELENINIDRCLVDKKTTITRQSAHTFVDASKSAYAAAVYLRTQYSNDDVTVNLIAANARGAPLKSLSIPKLELCATVLGLRLTQTVPTDNN